MRKKISSSPYMPKNPKPPKPRKVQPPKPKVQPPKPNMKIKAKKKAARGKSTITLPK
jgi:hypothetical protein